MKCGTKTFLTDVRSSLVRNAIRSNFIKQFKLQARIFKTQIADIHQSPTRKNVHQLRITARRIRAALWLAEHGSPNLSFGKLKADLRKLGRVLGHLRELDVAIKDATEYKLKSKGLKKRRRSARKALLAQTSYKHRRNVLIHLNKALLKIQAHQDQTLATSVVLLRKRILLWTQTNLATEDDFHRLRIVIKKTRYILESMGKRAQPLRDLQDVIGKGHDLEVLQDFSKGSPEVRDATEEQYRKARQMIRPSLRFAIKQLSTAIDHYPR